MKILVTGAGGFIGKNLLVRLGEIPGFQALPVYREDSDKKLEECVQQADWIVHLAGVNRPKQVSEFDASNSDLTRRLCNLRSNLNPRAGLIFASSVQAAQSNPYGNSKLAAEGHIKELSASNSSTLIYRLPNVFGKWCKPNYNSVVATFCYNISQGLPIKIDDPDKVISLVYIDDLIEEFLSEINDSCSGMRFAEPSTVYQVSLQDLANHITDFAQSRDSLVMGQVGIGLQRALYATFLSYLKPEQFHYPLISKGDERGEFFEVLKTKESGQFSVFTAKPGVTRGGHYHHTKTEKFLVLQGRARFGFRHIMTNETHTLDVNAGSLEIVETAPGWAHDITNVGQDTLVVLLWANEIFDDMKPDTIGAVVEIE